MENQEVYKDDVFENEQVKIESVGYESGNVSLCIKVKGSVEVSFTLTLDDLDELQNNLGLFYDSMHHLTTPDPYACPNCGHSRYPSMVIEGNLLCPICDR